MLGFPRFFLHFLLFESTNTKISPFFNSSLPATTTGGAMVSKSCLSDGILSCNAAAAATEQD